MEGCRHRDDRTNPNIGSISNNSYQHEIAPEEEVIQYQIILPVVSDSSRWCLRPALRQRIGVGFGTILTSFLGLRQIERISSRLHIVSSRSLFTVSKRPVKIGPYSTPLARSVVASSVGFRRTQGKRVTHRSIRNKLRCIAYYTSPRRASVLIFDGWSWSWGGWWCILQ